MSRRAIPTRYKGYHFRSRLEARWAVFFDELDIPWKYEIEGYMVGDEGEEVAYLPDFYLPATDTWVEVKGDPAKLDLTLMTKCVDWDSGLPGTYDSKGSTRGLLMLGDIPSPDRGGRVLHPILQHRKGVWLHLAYFLPGTFSIAKDPLGDVEFGYLDSSWGEVPADDPTAAAARDLLPGRLAMEDFPHIEWTAPSSCYASFIINDAHAAARSARFEHGHRGAS